MTRSGDSWTKARTKFPTTVGGFVPADSSRRVEEQFALLVKPQPRFREIDLDAIRGCRQGDARAQPRRSARSADGEAYLQPAWSLLEHRCGGRGGGGRNGRLIVRAGHKVQPTMMTITATRGTRFRLSGLPLCSTDKWHRFRAVGRHVASAAAAVTIEARPPCSSPTDLVRASSPAAPPWLHLQWLLRYAPK